MSFEELIKKYEPSMAVPMYPKALVIDFMKKAYEARLHADVHTDNSAVIADLEKENAELKGIKDVATLIRANNDTVVTLMQLNNMLVSERQQLTKAKDHIKQLLDCLKQDTNDPETNYYVCQYMDKAEQFLNEVEK